MAWELYYERSEDGTTISPTGDVPPEVLAWVRQHTEIKPRGWSLEGVVTPSTNKGRWVVNETTHFPSSKAFSQYEEYPAVEPIVYVD